MSIKNHQLRLRAVMMRKKGKSYSEILKAIPVAKSTLGLWLKDVALSTPQKQRLTKKRLAGVKRGGQAKRNQRIQTTREIEERSIMEIGKISPRELFLIGVILYWAEGSKQKEHNPSERVIFSNSDALMIDVFINWLKKVGIPEDQMNISLYIHETARHRVDEIARYWSKSLKLRINKLEKIYYKKGSLKSFRRNVASEYYGQVRVTVKKSTNLNRRIHGWVLGITKG